MYDKPEMYKCNLEADLSVYDRLPYRINPELRDGRSIKRVSGNVFRGYYIDTSEKRLIIPNEDFDETDTSQNNVNSTPINDISQNNTETNDINENNETNDINDSFENLDDIVNEISNSELTDSQITINDSDINE